MSLAAGLGALRPEGTRTKFIVLKLCPTEPQGAPAVPVGGSGLQRLIAIEVKAQAHWGCTTPSP